MKGEKEERKWRCEKKRERKRKRMEKYMIQIETRYTGKI